MTQEQLQQVLLMQSRIPSFSGMYQAIDSSPQDNGMWSWQVQQLIAPSAAASSGFSPQQQMQHHNHRYHHQQQQQQQCQGISRPQYHWPHSHQKAELINTCPDKASCISKKDTPHQLGLLIPASSPVNQNV
jgi:hypothetical protein